jgi:signal transduction histidine kinase
MTRKTKSRSERRFATTVRPPPGLGALRASEIRYRRLFETAHDGVLLLSPDTLAASNLELSLEITQRKAAEEALKKSERHYSQLLEKSERLQEQLRQLSRQILSAQEDERKKISRELHDVIAQTLTGINVRLAALKKEAALNTKGLDRNIARTQRLVEKSVNIVHQFARELRPAVLDDLGLIPALHSFMKLFSARTGVRTHLKAFADVEQLDTARRTVLFRVAQEALTNVARHAKASRVEVSIQKLPDGVCMKIKDDGKSFQVERVIAGQGNKRLGLLGMRERVEMVGGTFCVESAPGQGTTVRVEIPFAQETPPENPETKPLNVHETNHCSAGGRPHDCARRISQDARTRRRPRSRRRSARRPPGGRAGQKTSSRRGVDGHRHAAAQWFGGHPPDSQSLPRHQSAHALRAQR